MAWNTKTDCAGEGQQQFNWLAENAERLMINDELERI
jgi:hypothetical protein